MEEREILRLLLILKQKLPDTFRHLLGLIRSLVKG